MLHSKSDFINCLKKIVLPLENYYTPGFAGIKCGNTGVHYGEKISLFEAFVCGFGYAYSFWCIYVFV